MAKRQLSPAPLPPSKRQHTLEVSSSSHLQPQLTFETALYDELILNIFSYLAFKDLACISSVSRNWHRLSADEELWRKLFSNVYGRRRLQGTRGFIGRTDGREVKALPRRSTALEQPEVDWKWMFRISTNFRTGRCAVEHLSNEIADEVGQAADTLILVSGNLTVTASTNPSPLPSIQLHNSTSVFLAPCKSSHAASYSITALALDQSPPISGHLNVAAFLSTGEFLVLSIDHAHPSATTNKLTHLPSRRDDRSLVTHAAYHQSLLVSLSENFTLSIYDLSSGSVRHSQTLSTFSSYTPTSIVLSSTTRELYKLVLAYSVPVYPSHWSVGATELLIGAPHSPETLSSNTSARINPKAPGRVVSTRTVRAFQVAEGWIDQGKLRLMREQWSRRVLRVADIQTDGRYVVLASGDSSPFTTGSSIPFTNAPSLHSPTNIQLYRLSLPMVSPSVAAPRPKLNFVRNLEGQNGPVSSIALADGRCVSYGVNGSIFVWDLDQGTGAEVAAPRSPPTPESYSTAVFDRRSVTFDERRIITASGTGSVVVRRFDI